jgi:hypothetical protein
MNVALTPALIQPAVPTRLLAIAKTVFPGLLAPPNLATG